MIGDNRRFRENNATAFDIDQGIGSAEVNRHILREQACQITQSKHKSIFQSVHNLNAAWLMRGMGSL
jgi:hypothetical protein